MTETMLTKAAKAICQATSKRNGWNPDRAWAASQNEFIEDAAAALEVIRDGLPESVIRAGDNADYFCSEGIKISRMIDYGGIQTVFTAMIDAILSQSQEGKHP
jgi:hypothetical protein